MDQDILRQVFQGMMLQELQFKQFWESIYEILIDFNRPKQPGQMVGMDQKDTYIGDEVNSKLEYLRKFIR